MDRRAKDSTGGIRRAVAVLTVLLVAAAGCSNGASPESDGEIRGVPAPTPAGEAEPAPEPTPELPPLPAELTRQALDWGECGRPSAAQGGGSAPGKEWRCATLTVPLDYADPGGRTLELALVRARHQGAERIGSLVFNFGGPGGSGVASLPRMADTFAGLRAGFDLVSMDPRGVGASSGVVCLSDAERDAQLAAERIPGNATEEREYLQRRVDYAEDCADAAGDLLPRLGTVNAARDLELLRRALGDGRLNYYGVSYGTKLGAVYAGLYPERVGRMTLDSVIDPTSDVVRRSLRQTAGFQLALDNYLAHCTAGAGCPIGADVPAGQRFITELLDSLADQPLPTESGRPLTQSLAVTAVLGSLYSESGWDRLTEGLREAGEEGLGTRLLAAADRYNGRNAQGRYRNVHDANIAINCADFASRPDLDTVRGSRAAFTEASAVFGRYMVWDLLACAGWPVHSEQDQPEVLAEGARRILLVATTGDPATPYPGAERMRRALGDGVGVLLTYEGEGHGAYTGGNRCVIDAVDGHLLAAAVPEDGTVCT
jgi:pimeloyl-ACP methyl ester carboxylesterase